MLHMRDLKLAYRETYWQLRKALIKCGEDGPDAPTLRGAISDVNFTIMWLHTGKLPGNKRGIERRSAYQREKLMDPVRLQAYVEKSKAGSPTNLSDWEMFQLEEALRRLSDRERDCYVMCHGHGFSHSYIAELLKIEKTSVDEYIKRAQKKVSADLGGNLFLM
ncbi:sigma factor-like helix-turn-helix DNA-binding protein [Paenibacillus xanthanilyticus]